MESTFNAFTFLSFFKSFLLRSHYIKSAPHQTATQLSCGSAECLLHHLHERTQQEEMLQEKPTSPDYSKDLCLHSVTVITVFDAPSNF